LFPPIHPDLRFHNYASYLRRRIGGAAARISVDGGFTCPNRDGTRGTGGCRYCNTDSFSGGILFPGLPVEEQVRRTIQSPGRHRNARHLLVYFQRFSNSYAPPEELDRIYRTAFCHPDIAGIIVGTRPDCLGSEALDVLEDIGREKYVCVEIGLQSRSDAVLARVNRGHTVDEFVSAVASVRARRIDTGVHLVYGLPGDTRENFVETAGFLSDLDVQGVKLHHFHVVAGSAMARDWRIGIVRVSPEVAVLRLIGSAPPGVLIAPLWEAGGRDMARDVAGELRKRGTWQGALR
jgi:radical SAM protein (TIGR01212 family)